MALRDELKSFKKERILEEAERLFYERGFRGTSLDAIAESLEKSVMPGLRDEIVTSFYLTPQDFQDRLLSFKGAAFGMEPLLLQSAWFRPHNRSEDLEGLYVVGAGTHPGAGMPGVLASAKALMSVLPEAASVVRARR